MTILFTLTLGEMILILIEGYYVFSFEGKACLGGFEKNFDILVTFLSQTGYHKLESVTWYTGVVYAKSLVAILQLALYLIPNLISNAKNGNNGWEWLN